MATTYLSMLTMPLFTITINELKPLWFQATFWMERLLCDLQGDDDSWSFWKFQPGFTIVVSNIIEGEDLLFQRCNGKIYWIWFSKLYWRRVIIKQKLEEENKNKTFPPFSALKKKFFFTFFLQAGAERKVSFDWGPDGSKAEDCFFGIVALDQVDAAP